MTRSVGDLHSFPLIPSRPVTPPRRLGLIACLVGAGILSFGIGPALGQDLASGTPGAAAWSEWLEQHRQLEYTMGAKSPRRSVRPSRGWTDTTRHWASTCATRSEPA
jgi:hypothetical protein